MCTLSETLRQASKEAVVLENALQYEKAKDKSNNVDSNMIKFSELLMLGIFELIGSSSGQFRKIELTKGVNALNMTDGSLLFMYDDQAVIMLKTK